MKYKIISTIIFVFFMLMGVLSSIILFHELYHLHLSGEVVGVCIGFCDVQGQIAPAYLNWQVPTNDINNIILNNELVKEPVNEERNAWIFGLGITSILFLSLFLTWRKNE